MGVSKKHKRKLIYKEVTYFWYVKEDDDYCGQLTLNIVSDNKELFLTYPLGASEPYLVSKGRSFQGKKTDGKWNRYILPFEGQEIITPKFVSQLISFATEVSGAV